MKTFIKRLKFRKEYKVILKSLFFFLLCTSLSKNIYAENLELNQECTASVLNRIIQVTEEGSFGISNIPVPLGNFRIRIVCDREFVIDNFQSEFLTGIPNGETILGSLFESGENPIPVFLSISTPADTLTAEANGVQLVTTGALANDTEIDLTLEATGTFYLSSNPSIATVSPDGFVLAQSSGRVLITATHEGVIATIQLTVNLTQDADNDGLPDDFETLNALNPGGVNLFFL